MSKQLIRFLCLGVLAAASAVEARRVDNSCQDISDQARVRGNGLIRVSMTTLQHTVTNFDPSWFDMENPEKAPTLFFLTLNLPDSLAGKVHVGETVPA